MEIRLNELLEERNMTRSELARKMGITPDCLPTASRSKPSLANLQRIADALEVPVWELLVDCGVSALGVKNDKPVENIQTCPFCGAVIKTNVKITVVEKN